MSNEIKYVKKIEISKLWDKFDIEWNLHPDVNILAGGNGSGKSTILNAMWIAFMGNKSHKEYNANMRSISIFLKNNELPLFAEFAPLYKTFPENIINGELEISFISTFDNRLIEAEAIQKLSNDNVKTVLDWEIYQLQKQYLDYQLNLSKKKDLIIDKNEVVKEKIDKLRYPQNRFLDMLNELFGETGKKVDRTKNEISFLLDNQIEIKPYQLSSGEKQLLIILLTVLIQDNKQAILFMDEPETSLHIDWQQKLIGYIRELNPNIQLIIATHSPAIIMEGWLDKVFNVSDIIVKNHQIAKK